MKFMRTLKRVVHNSDRIAVGLERLEETNRAIIEGMNNQSRLMNDKSNELIAASSSADSKLAAIIAAMDNQSCLMGDKSNELIAASSSVDTKLAAMITGMDNQSRLMNDKSDQLIAASSSVDSKLAAITDVLNEATRLVTLQSESLEREFNNFDRAAGERSEALEGSINGLLGNQRVVFDSLRFQLARIADLLRATVTQTSHKVSGK